MPAFFGVNRLYSGVANEPVNFLIEQLGYLITALVGASPRGAPRIK